MQIGIIGAGAMAKALGGGWALAGHEVFIGARSVTAATELAASIGHGARGGSIETAAAFGTVTLLAIPADVVLEVVRTAGTTFAGQTLIDCTNAFAPDEVAPQDPNGFMLTDEAAAARLAAAVPDAHVVKAFNLCAAEVWAADVRTFEGRPLAVPLCGDDAAVEVVAGLAEDLKFQPIRAGGLQRAKYLEAMSVFMVGLWFGGHDVRAIFPPLEAAFAVAD